MSGKTMISPVVLCVLDGWGCAEEGADNAIAQARTPQWDAMVAKYPHSKLMTSGLDVGLPEGQMGNSEVGHMNIGCGRVILQDLPRIDAAIADGRLGQAEALQGLIGVLRASGGVCHLMGLLSDGGVHAHLTHMFALVDILAEAGVPVVVHAFLDGRDTPPSSAKVFLEACERAIAGKAVIGTVSGRYYAMDRDKRWDRVQLAYDAMVSGQGMRAATAMGALEASYAAGKTDEFVLPAVIGGYAGMKDGDGLLMANFRADRVRQLSDTLLNPAFEGFGRSRIVRFVKAVGMAEYSVALNRFYDTVFPPQEPRNGLGEVVSQRGLKQLRIAETEKYAHVTFFFNGGVEEPFEGEDRILVPSPKVATYDLKPEMSAPELTDKLVAAIGSGQYQLIVANYANTDMVGHTGIQAAAIQAVEAVDTCLGRVLEAVEAAGGVLCVSADHGNAEMMHDHETEQAHTAHTLNPVPFVLAGKGMAKSMVVKDGKLADIAPTLLALMGIAIPDDMTGEVLLDGYQAGKKYA